jgi:hypothetical protein
MSFFIFYHVSYAVLTITQFQGQFRIGKCLTNDISLCCHVKTSPNWFSSSLNPFRNLRASYKYSHDLQAYISNFVALLLC